MNINSETRQGSLSIAVGPMFSGKTSMVYWKKYHIHLK